MHSKPTVDVTSIHVLVIDDHRTMRAIIRQLLGRVGISKISEAEHGEQGLALVRNPSTETPDVIICDLHMKTMDGLEFCNILRRSDNDRHRGIPILILTGDQDKMLHSVGRQVGAAKILMKPISANELLAEIRAAIGYNAGVSL